MAEENFSVTLKGNKTITSGRSGLCWRNQMKDFFLNHLCRNFATFSLISFAGATVFKIFSKHPFVWSIPVIEAIEWRWMIEVARWKDVKKRRFGQSEILRKTRQKNRTHAGMCNRRRGRRPRYKCPRKKDIYFGISPHCLYSLQRSHWCLRSVGSAVFVTASTKAAPASALGQPCVSGAVICDLARHSILIMQTCLLAFVFYFYW